MRDIIGFRHAFRGLFLGVRQEKNLRIHLAAVFYVTWYATILRIETQDLTVLILCFGLVISLELINTALERLCDRMVNQKDDIIKAVKDMAAGAVLVTALASVAVAGVVFVRAELWDNIAILYSVILPAIFVPIWMAIVFLPMKKKSKDLYK